MATTKAIPAPSRFLSDTKSRIGKCITFGVTSPPHFTELSGVLTALTRNWRRLAVGREGYNTSPERAGLLRHRIAWGDHDQMGHVNNVVYNFWAETARINWARAFALQSTEDKERRQMWEDLVTPRGIGLILRSIKTDYKFPLQYPDRVTVIHRLLQEPKRGMDALHLEAVVLSETHQRVAAKITEDIAVYDYRVGKKAPLPDFMVEVLLEEWKAQQHVMRKAKSEIKVLQGKVRKVEQETWDREDAVEDMGSAATTTEAPQVQGGDIKEVEKGAEIDEVSLEVQVTEQAENEAKNHEGKQHKKQDEKNSGIDEIPLEFQVSRPKNSSWQ
jgi:acyl-CoA thioesterase FadM